MALLAAVQPVLTSTAIEIAAGTNMPGERGITLMGHKILESMYPTRSIYESPVDTPLALFFQCVSWIRVFFGQLPGLSQRCYLVSLIWSSSLAD